MLLPQGETWLSQFAVTGSKLKRPATRKIHGKSFALRLVNISRNQNFAQSAGTMSSTTQLSVYHMCREISRGTAYLKS